MPVCPVISITAHYNRLGVTWPDVDDAADYVVALFSDAAGEDQLQSEIVSGTSYTFEDLMTLTDYYVRVSPRNDQGQVTTGCDIVPTATTEAQDPSAFADLWGWWKADTGITGTATVTGWADQSGNGHNLTADSGKEPELATNVINGHPVIRRGAIDASMKTAANWPDISASGTNACTVMLVAKQSNAGGLDTLGAFMVAGSQRNILFQRNGGLQAIRMGMNTSSGGVLATNSGITEDQFYTFTLATNGTVNYFSPNDDFPNSVLNVPQSPYAGSPLQLFAISNSAYGNKSIAEIAVFTRFLTDDEKTELRTYFRDKYNHY